MQDKIIDGKKCAEELKNNLKKEINAFKTKPGLVDIQIGDNEASNIYIKSKKRQAEEIGINFYHIKFDDGVEENIIIDKIKELNNDSDINGILIQLPLPSGYDEKKLINYIAPEKDVDGLTEANTGKLFLNKNSLISCTPNGVIKLLKENNIEISGKNVVIIGRSNLVGKPLIHLFLKENATVTVCHTKTKNIESHTRCADILVVACGSPKFIKNNMIKDGVVIIDVGINRVDGKISGDVDFDDVYNKTSKITKVPGGVGPMTVAMLLYNTVISYKRMNGYDKYEQ